MTAAAPSPSAARSAPAGGRRELRPPSPPRPPHSRGPSAASEMDPPPRRRRFRRFVEASSPSARFAALVVVVALASSSSSSSAAAAAAAAAAGRTAAAVDAAFATTTPPPRTRKTRRGSSPTPLPVLARRGGAPPRPSSSGPSSSSTSISSFALSLSATPAEAERAERRGSTTKKRGAAAGRGWFPVRPSDALPSGGGGGYDAVVRGAHLRHVAVETEEVADLALGAYLRGEGVGRGGGIGGGGEAEVEVEGRGKGGGGGADPFGDLARDLSACVLSRDEGGKVGWVDNPSYSGRCTSSADGGASVGAANEAVRALLPPDVVDRAFRSRPKGGDVLKLRSDETGLWHLVRVDDLLVDYVPDTAGADGAAAAAVGSQTGANKVIAGRGKLKGSGVAPRSPRIVVPGAASSKEDGAADAVAADEDVAKTYHISTTGCQMNVADSERLAGVLQNTLGLTEAEKPSDADVVVLNTCTIRDHAEQKVYDALGPHAARKRRGESVAVVVAGCVAQQEGERLLRRVPEVDLVMGPQYAARLGDLLEGVGRGHQIVATDPTLISEDLSRPVRGHGVRGWVNVIHGCNEHCTYCVVPGVRGVEQSRPMEAILAEILGLADAGYKEVTLLGQNIDAYGRDMVPRRTFADLLRYLNDNVPEGTVERIRYVTSHPRYFSDRVIDAVADLDKVCECFHMPFQSGDDKVLRDMRRGYTFESYMKIISKIRERAPDASICGDVIVGFPGESEAAFQRTLDLMEQVKFDNLNTFAYSPRPNTEAALWDNQVPDDVKAERLQIVQRLATKHGLERSERYLGRDVEVLVEDRNPRDVGQVMGRTRQGRQVFFDGDAGELMGRLVVVRIEEARPWSLAGRMVGMEGAEAKAEAQDLVENK